MTGLAGHTCRYEVDKLSSSQRLDLNLEKGRMRDELQALRDKSNEMEIKMDRSALACCLILVIRWLSPVHHDHVTRLSAPPCVVITPPCCLLSPGYKKVESVLLSWSTMLGVPCSQQ